MDQDAHDQFPARQVGMSAESARCLATLLRAPFETELAASLTDQQEDQIGLACALATQAWQQLFEDDGLGLSLESCLHIGQRFQFHEQLAAGRTYRAVLSLTKTRRRDSHDVIEFQVDISAAGRLRCTAATTLWSFQQDKAERTRSIAPASSASPTLLAGPNILTLTPAQLRSYAQLSGDHNPIHLDPEAAQNFGYPAVIAHGMFLLAACGQRIVDDLDRPAVRSLQAGFNAPLVVGEGGAQAALSYRAGEQDDLSYEFQLTDGTAQLFSRARVEFAS